jgi:uncharacterized protein YciI
LFVVILKYLKPLSEVDRYIEPHVRFLDENYAAGNFLMSGRRVPRTGGVILARANSRAALEDILRRDPFHLNGLAEYDIIEFEASKRAPELSGIML